jgi:assimilatory nitrate reductase catalytic subunit
VAVIQLIALGVIAMAGTSNPRILLAVYIPLIVVVSAWAALAMDNLDSVRNDTGAARLALADRHTSIMSLRYIGTFGSFIGYSFAFGLVLQTQFGRPPLEAAAVTFIGPLLGSLIRPVGGRLADRLGGARVTFVNFVAIVPGTDLALALGMLHAAVVDGHVDADYLAARTTGFDEAWRVAAQWWPERAERVCGVPAADMRTVVGWLAGAARRYVLTARGAEQHAQGVDTVSGWINLALALGLPGRPGSGSGFGTVTGQGNGQGGREHGQKPDQLPGYRSITDPAARAHVAKVWGVDPDGLPGAGRSATELLAALGRPDGPKALLVFGSNVLVSAPHANAVAQRLAALDLLVVADIMPGETAMAADVVLPVAQWAEEEGTMTNLEGRILRRRRAIPPPPGVRTDLEVVSGLAAELGVAGFPAEARAVFDELRAASAGGIADYSGISYDRLDAGEALHWPCPAPGHPGTPRLFTERFAHADGRARLVPVDHTGPAELPDADRPLRATTGRVLVHYQSGAQTRRVAELTGIAPESFVEVHPDTAARAGLADGDRARVVSRRGSAVARVRCVASLRPDTVFLPFHFGGEQAANLVTNPVLDPISRMPEFKVCAVRLEPA